MKKDDLIDSIGHIDNEMLENVDKIRNRKKRPRKIWIAWASIAACIVVGLFVGIQSRDNNSVRVLVGGIERDYKKDTSISYNEEAFVWPWEYLLPCEQYATLYVEGREYISSEQSINESLIANVYGEFDVVGNDDTGIEHRLQTEVHSIKGISEIGMLAVKIDEQYYVYKNMAYNPPIELGQILDDYSLTHNLRLNDFSTSNDYTDTGYYYLESDDYIWEVISSCRDAKFEDGDMWTFSGKEYISFSVTSETLGVYKRTFSVTADGYIQTNVFDYSYVFNIGSEKAKQIIDYAKKNSKESKPEPYAQYIAGTVTELTDDYIVVDDSIMCKNSKDGVAFKVFRNDLRIERGIKFGKIGVGDIAVISFRGNIDIEAGNVVTGAYCIDKGYYSEDGIFVNE